MSHHKTPDGLNIHRCSNGPSYGVLAVELSVDFVIMYLVMYTMIATLDHFYININNVYMTLMMGPIYECDPAK